jgi:hypothetical protein
MVDINGLDKAEVLASFQPGEQVYFDYLRGRVMKVDLSKDAFDPWLYDRDNGAGAAERAVSRLRGPVAA